jgi:subtilase family serine protease
MSGQQLTVAGPDRKGLYKVGGSITVTNQGNEESGACLMRLYYPDGAKMILKRATKLKKLKAGQSATVKVNANKLTPVTGSSSQFKAVVDADGAIAEAREDNNRTLYTISLP